MIDANPNLLRFLTFLPLAWAAWSDHHTRRVDRRVWAVLIGIGAVAAIWQVNQIAPVRTQEEYQILTQLVVVPPVAGVVSITLYRVGAFGAGDAKAFFILGLVFPTPIEYRISLLSYNLQLPIHESQLPLIAIGFNTLLFAVVLYLFKMWIQNLLHGERNLKSITTRKISVDNIPETPGQMKWTDDRGNTHRLDLDTLRMYFRWRGIEIGELSQQSNKLQLQSEDILETVYQVDDGRVSPPITQEHPLASSEIVSSEDTEVADQMIVINEGDTWGASTFLESIDHNGYGATPEEIHQGLERIQDGETIRIQPGVAFIIPLFLGAITATTVGDITALLVKAML